jgi:hypothetical protein
MAFTVLKVPKTGDDNIEVIGEFPNREDAEKFADETRTPELENEYDYLIEAPPSRQD